MTGQARKALSEYVTSSINFPAYRRWAKDQIVLGQKSNLANFIGTAATELPLYPQEFVDMCLKFGYTEKFGWDKAPEMYKYMASIAVIPPIDEEPQQIQPNEATKNHNGLRAENYGRHAGHDWSISTSKRGKKIICSANAGRLKQEPGMSSFLVWDMFASNTKLAEKEGRATAKAINEVHALGCAEFTRRANANELPEVEPEY